MIYSVKSKQTVFDTAEMFLAASILDALFPGGELPDGVYIVDEDEFDDDEDEFEEEPPYNVILPL